MANAHHGRYWLAAWLLLVLFMAGAAYAKRDMNLKHIGRDVVMQLEHYAETGDGDLGDYIYDWQGPAVYGIERGYRDPQLLRVMLLCEARRSYDSAYVYPWCLNYDLRQHLISECQENYPDDPRVAWAVGRLHLTDGDYWKAVEQLLRAHEMGIMDIDVGVKDWYKRRRLTCALKLTGRFDRLEELYEEWTAIRSRGEFDHNAVKEYAEYLMMRGEYSRAEELIADRASADPGLPQTLGLDERIAWWQGDMDGVLSAVSPFWDQLNSRAGLAMSLKYGDYGSIEHEIRDTGSDFDYSSVLDQWDSRKFSNSVVRLRKQVAEAYAITGDPAILSMLQALYADKHTAYEAVANESGSTHQSRNDAFGDLMAAHDALALAYILTGQWDDLTALTAAEYGNHWMTTNTLVISRLLCDIYSGGPIAEHDGQLLREQLLPDVLSSDYYFNAVEASGRYEAGVRAEILKACIPDRDDYHDSTNGKLDW